ncbi:MAG: hypothetical protein CMM00_11710 [Rhodopirellula sp.]|nr:hypothetical protein [Rhodopirellula sp.]
MDKIPWWGGWGLVGASPKRGDSFWFRQFAMVFEMRLLLCRGRDATFPDISEDVLAKEKTPGSRGIRAFGEFASR